MLYLQFMHYINSLHLYIARYGMTYWSVPLSSCGCPGLERIWEADLEACHLFLRGLQLRTPSCGGADLEDLPPATVYLPTQPCTKEEEDCAMLTALGGRWCPEANLQNSEFTKVTQQCVVNNKQCIIHLNACAFIMECMAERCEQTWDSQYLEYKMCRWWYLTYFTPIFASSLTIFFLVLFITAAWNVTSN